MANYPQELAQDAVCQSHTGHMTGLWFLPAQPLRLNTNDDDDDDDSPQAAVSVVMSGMRGFYGSGEGDVSHARPIPRSGNA